MCPDFLGRPILICHMFYTKINKLFFALVYEFIITSDLQLYYSHTSSYRLRMDSMTVCHDRSAA